MYLRYSKCKCLNRWAGNFTIERIEIIAHARNADIQRPNNGCWTPLWYNTSSIRHQASQDCCRPVTRSRRSMMLSCSARSLKISNPANFVRQRPVSLSPMSHLFPVFVSQLIQEGRMMVIRASTLGNGFMLELRARNFLKSQLGSSLLQVASY